MNNCLLYNIINHNTLRRYCYITIGQDARWNRSTMDFYNNNMKVLEQLDDLK